jgi:hypothetical protein
MSNVNESNRMMLEMAMMLLKAAMGEQVQSQIPPQQSPLPPIKKRVKPPKRLYHGTHWMQQPENRKRVLAQLKRATAMRWVKR